LRLTSERNAASFLYSGLAMSRSISSSEA
jgi:hypothetical protein